MALELYMLGLITQDMHRSLEFYRQLGLAIPAGSDEQTHVEVKMGSGLTFFLDSKPARWDPGLVRNHTPERVKEAGSYPAVLEFYLKERGAVDAKYKELTDSGYHSHSAPYETSFGMYFVLIDDPDGNTILLSAEL